MAKQSTVEVGNTSISQKYPRCRMEYLYKHGERQGCKCRTHRHFCQSIQDITDLSQLRRGAQKDA